MCIRYYNKKLWGLYLKAPQKCVYANNSTAFMNDPFIYTYTYIASVALNHINHIPPQTTLSQDHIYND